MKRRNEQKEARESGKCEGKKIRKKKMVFRFVEQDSALDRIVCSVLSGIESR